MNLQQIKAALQSKEYLFLQDNVHLGEHILLLGVGGSHAYGTDIATSDLDIRGIAKNSKKEILLGQDFEQVVNNQTDTTIYSLKKALTLFASCNPNMIELLGLKKEHYLYLSPIGEELLKNRHRFLSQKAIQSFGGYANSQLYRLQQKTLCQLTEQEYNQHICKVLQSMDDHLQQNYGFSFFPYLDSSGTIRIDFSKIQGKSDVCLDELSSLLAEMNNTLRSYRSHSKRNEYALEHGRICKHMMHLVRLYYTCLDILKEQEIITYRAKEHDLLMDIRNGSYCGKDGKPNQAFFDLVSQLQREMDNAKQSTKLPKEADEKWIQEFLMDVNQSIVLQHEKEEKEIER